MSEGYRVVFGSVKIQKYTVKFLRTLPRNLQQRLYDAMKELGKNPRPQQSKRLSLGVLVYGYTAQYRLRVGDYRILYDVDDRAETVVVLAIRKREEKTYA